jgi:hypothetical protein
MHFFAIVTIKYEDYILSVITAIVFILTKERMEKEIDLDSNS